MEDQVTSLEMSKKLKEAGFEVGTSFLWSDGDRYPKEWHLIYVLGPSATGGWVLPAYTFQQLYEYLCGIDGLDIRMVNHVLIMESYGSPIGLSWESPDKNNSLPDTAGEAILWCIKEGYYENNKSDKN